MTLSVVLRKAIVDKLGLTRESPIGGAAQRADPVGHDRRNGTGRGLGADFQIPREKIGAIRTVLKFVYIGAPNFPPR